MAIGLSGMVSGLDTESIVKALVSAQKTKSTKIEDKITMNKWTTEAWSDLNKKIYSFYTSYASKLRFQSSYQTRSATSANEDVVKATASSTAAVGTHTLQVQELASSQYVTGAKISGTADTYSKATKLTELGMTAGSYITIKGAIGSAEEKTVKFEITDTSTINDFISACKDAGLTASFDATQQRMFISSADSGTEQKFSITSSTLSTESSAYLTNLQSELSASGADLSDAFTTLKENSDLITTVLSASYDETDATQKAVRDALTEIEGAAVQAAAAEQAEADLKSEELAAISQGAADGTFTLYGEEYTYSELVTELGLESETDQDVINEAIRAHVATEHADDRSTEVAARTTVYATDDENDDNDFYSNFISAFESDMASNISTTGASELTKLGLGEITGAAVNNKDSNGDSIGMVVVAAADAKVVLDGATMVGSSNSFAVNGINLDLKSTSYNKTTGEYDTISLTVSKDTESTYSMVKDAVKAYNELIEEMNKLYYADSARDYKPLTDEQKEAMTDDEVENWENKIKSALLRRDSTLGSLLTGMRSALAKSYSASDGTEYTLSSFGIVTGNYTERGKLHIYGDTDDTAYATYDDRLEEMLANDPDTVMEALSGIFSNLYTTMTEKCAKTSISSALTFYNDKQYASYLSDYEDDLDKMNDKLKDLEDRYYKQFTAMETALSKLQSNSNSLAQMLGGGTTA
ncbi:MAG: flagellar filament capping protein FliD [Lachnospiraceae bacterium]|nr:flagellar filament capping protein FliD [Lachnospiraceae bacterium]